MRCGGDQKPGDPREAHYDAHLSVKFHLARQLGAREASQLALDPTLLANTDYSQRVEHCVDEYYKSDW